MQKTHAQELHDEFKQRQHDRRMQSTPKKPAQEAESENKTHSIWETIIDQADWNLTTL